MSFSKCDPKCCAIVACIGCDERVTGEMPSENKSKAFRSEQKHGFCADGQKQRQHEREHKGASRRTRCRAAAKMRSGKILKHDKIAECKT